MVKSLTHSPKILKILENGSGLILALLQETLGMIEDLPKQTGSAVVEYQERKLPGVQGTEDAIWGLGGR